MTYTITDGLIAIYINRDGDIVAAEKVEGERNIAQNLLKTATVAREESEVLKVKVSVDTQVAGGNCCASSTKYVMMQICTDKNGRRVPCI